MEKEELKKVMEKLSYGVYIVTMGIEKYTNALTASWVTQVSFEPPLVAVSIYKERYSKELAEGMKVFTVNILGQDQRNLALRFTKPAKVGEDKFAGLTVETKATGAPILGEALAYLDCEIVETLPVGDHVLFVGEIKDAKVLRPGECLTTRDASLRYRRA
jgi:flavin reductase (DIM6/NTAB) family NADH-FMN oxidoreductase RutF